MSKNRKLSRKEVIRVNDLLSQHLLPSTKSPGHFVYAEGWSDADIARAIAPDIQAHSVQGVRQELYGHLDTKKPNKTPDVTTLEKKLKALCAQLGVDYDTLGG